MCRCRLFEDTRDGKQQCPWCNERKDFKCFPKNKYLCDICQGKFDRGVRVKDNADRTGYIEVEPDDDNKN